MAGRGGLARWIHWRRAPAPRLPDPADMGTKFGLEMSMAERVNTGPTIAQPVPTTAQAPAPWLPHLWPRSRR